MPRSSGPLPLAGNSAVEPAPLPPGRSLLHSGPLFPASWERAARRRNVADKSLLYVVAIGVSLVGGLVIRALQWDASSHASPVGAGVFTRLDLALVPAMSIVAAGAFTTAVVHGVLLRSWWSLLAAPAAFVAGVLLWHLGDVGVRAAVAAVTAPGKSWGYWGQVLAGEVSGEVWLLMWRCAVPAVFGAALGTALARRRAVGQVRRPGGAQA